MLRRRLAVTDWVVSGFLALNPHSGVVLEVQQNRVVAYHLARAGDDTQFVILVEANSRDGAIAWWQSLMRELGVFREEWDWH